ncbi:hypothetical protein [Tahibacter amnicola]|uniref:Transglutaminase superfamily protein n=1 Tax=Tahibacter amnicola TaxID=2976241 RepID=A0ABY6BH78_9GAMM|nr:hypothetical protein [Tahibacter amnicola]UXI67961.1 hypothetical protein N4264_25075 [Tahibacter amnicola]
MLSVQTRRPPRRLSAILVCVVLFVGATAAAPTAERGWRVEISPGDAIYPVLDLSQGQSDEPSRTPSTQFGGGAGLVAVEVRARRADEPVALTVEAPFLAGPAQVEAVLPRRGETYRLQPLLRWDRQALASLLAPTRASMTFRLQRDDAVEVIERPVRVHPLGEALYYVRDGADHVDLGWIFAAYANPASPVVDEILAQARRNHPELPLTRDARRDTATAMAEAFAIWEVIHDHGVRYADEDPGLSRGPAVWSQRVRLHEQVWDEKRANCIDSSLLLAAAFVRLGIDSALVLVPRHAMLAFRVSASQTPQVLETTLLGSRLLSPRPVPAFAGAMDDYDRDAMDTFAAALAAGQARYAREAKGFRARSPDYQWIDLATARAYGIIPLAAPARANGR